MKIEHCQFELNRRKQRTLLPLRPPVQMISLLSISAISSISCAQCYIDPVTNQQICTPLTKSAHCRITVADGSAGSGTLVRRSESLGLVLTCSHLFDGAGGQIVVSFPNGQRFAARLVGRDTAHDLAALAIRWPDVEPVVVCAKEPSGPLSACGFGSDGQLRCIRGIVTGHATAVGALHPSSTINGAVRPGDSGGGVFNTSGELVGVVWGQRDDQTYATCGRPVREFLQRMLGQSASQPSAPPGGQTNEPERLDDSTKPESRLNLRIESLEQLLKQVAGKRVGFLEGVSFGKLLVGALGLSGPLAAAAIIAAGIAGRRMRNRIGIDRKVESIAGNPDRPEIPRPIPVDTPPPPQRTVPETHYVSVEKDSFAKAHQWAGEQVARKYPGAAEILQAQDSLIKQYLAAQ